MLETDLPEGEGISLISTIQGNPYPRPYIWGKNDKDEFLIKDQWKLLRKYKKQTLLYQSIDEEKKKLVNSRLATEMEYSDMFVRPFNRTVVIGDHSLEISVDQENYLYNLDLDPSENNNLADQFPAIVEQLGKLLDKQISASENKLKNFE